MKLRINKIENLNKINLVKTGVLVGTMLPTVLVGCNSIDASKYYLVHNDGNYYICYKGDKYINSCDIEYKSITDDKVVGVVCSNNNNFDYQEHHFSTEFLSELQICNLKDVLNCNLSQDELKNIVLSNRINELGDKYFKNRKYYFIYDNSPLNIYKVDEKIILGYDLSPERLDGSSAYVYSINDNDVVNLFNYDIDVYNISNYFSDDNYITYATAQELSNNKKLVKTIER